MGTFGDIAMAVLSGFLLALGYIFTAGLLAVPSFRLKALWNAGEGVDHFPVLYLMSLINALTWFSYGFFDPKIKAVVFINLVGAIVQIVYLVWYMRICQPSCKFVTGFLLAVVLLVFGTMGSINVLFPDAIISEGAGRESLNVPVMITSGLMYIGPLPDMVTAVCTQDHQRISMPIVLASFGNAFFWGEYGRAQGESIIQMSNECGMISPFVQAVAYVYLRWNEGRQMWEEIQELFHQVQQVFRNGYLHLPQHEDESDDA